MKKEKECYIHRFLINKAFNIKLVKKHSLKFVNNISSLLKKS